MDGLIGVLSDPVCLSATVSSLTDYPVYGGICEITPSEEQQVLDTKYRVLRSDIIINQIPSTYGRITWNGSVLTVS